MGFPPLKITEIDGAPAVYPIAIKFPNGSVTDNGDATVSVSFPLTTHTHDDRYYTETEINEFGFLTVETDPVFLAWDKSTGISITESQISDLQAYLLTELDPVFGASAAAGITGTDITNWGTAYTHSQDNTQAHSDYLLNTGDQMDGALIIDITDIEALLVRKNADGGDFFKLDTDNMVAYLYGGLIAATDSNLGLIIKKETGDISQFVVDCANQTILSYVPHHFFNHLYAEDDPMYLYDTGDNELVAFDTVATAVNYLSIANAATGNGPEINALGDNDNIDIEMNPKGTGGVAIGGTGTSIFQEGIVVNEGSADSDSRFEGNGDAYLLMIDAGTDRVGIGIAAPAQKLDVVGNIKLSAELMGCRQTLLFNRTSLTADGYLGAAAMAFTATTGFLMHRPGSIVGISIVTTVTETTPGTIIAQARKNDSSVFTTTITTSGSASYEAYETQARGVDTFAAGDTIVAYVDFGTFVGTAAPIGVMIEIVYDT